jgi:hypothetical protein
MGVKKEKRANDVWGEVGCQSGFGRVSEATRMCSKWGNDSIMLRSISIFLQIQSTQGMHSQLFALSIQNMSNLVVI